MKMKELVLVVAAIATLTISTQAHAAAMAFDQNVTPDVIFGSGNANGGFTVDQNNGVELGLRAKVRFPVPMNVFNSNGDGTYSHPAGNDAGRPLWSFEWTVNTDFASSTGVKLDDLTYALRIDTNTSINKTFTTFDPIIAPFADHAIGDNTTANGAGATAANAADYANLIANNNVAQNSWRMDFFFPAFGPAFDPNVDATYDFELAAFDSSGQVALTSMTVIIGAGGVVPEPTTFVLGGLGLALIGFGARRRRLR